MEECFDKLNTMLREASVDLVKERRREYIPSEFAEEIKERFIFYPCILGCLV